jgi:gamma-tubulin complex component 3
VTRQLVKVIRQDRSAGDKETLQAKLKNYFTRLNQLSALKNLGDVMKLLLNLSQQNQAIAAKKPSTQISLFARPDTQGMIINELKPIPYSDESTEESSRDFQSEETDLSNSVISELFKILLGRPSIYFRSDSGDRYSLQINLILPPNLKEIVAHISELAFRLSLLRRVTSEKSSSQTHNVIYEALRDFVAKIDQIIGEIQEAWNLSTSTTAMQMYTALVDVEDSVRLLSIIEEGVRSVGPTHALSVLAVWKKSGDSRMRTICQHLFGLASHGFLRSCLSWMNTGKLNQQADEFMVVCNPWAHQIWEEPHSLNHAKIPYFLDQEFAEYIFQIGRVKSLNTRFLPEADSSLVGTVHFDYFEDDFLIEKQKKTLSEVYSRSARHLVDLYLNKSELRSHLRFFKKAVLMEKGDFIDSLLLQLDKTLDLPAEEVYYHNVMPIFDSCMQKSSLRKEKKKFKQLLGIKLLEPTNGDLGWDVFCVEYQVRCSYLV